MARAIVIRMRAEGEYAKNMAEAFERVISAISKVERDGGTVSFDKDELLNLLIHGQQDFSDDKLINQASGD